MDKYEFIWKAIQIHGYKYDYRKVNYINCKTKVCIICPIHGEFMRIPDSHLNKKCGCTKCSKKYLDTDFFIEKAKAIHGDNYDYSKVDYKDAHTKICVICHKKDKDGNEHGEFWTLACNHIGVTNKCKCPKCAMKNRIKTKTSNTEEFIEKAKAIHGDKYDYSKVNYIGNHDNVCIICPIHGEFWQKPSKHLSNQGCPKCKDSKLEKEVETFLIDNTIKYIKEYKPDFLKKKQTRQSLDFYLPYYNLAIECQGDQHFKPVKYWGDINNHLKIIENDFIKYRLCNKHNIKILYYSNNKNIKNFLWYKNHINLDAIKRYLKL